MAGQFGTQTEVMQDAGQRVFDVREGIATQLGQLRTQLAPLEGTWRGDAATSFAHLMVRWNEEANRVNLALQALGEQVQASGAQYRVAEEEVATSTSQIAQTLG